MEELLRHPWLCDAQSPLPHCGLKMKPKREEMDVEVMWYMMTHLNLNEDSIIESVVNFKPNATTGNYFVLCQRLRRGHGLPKGAKCPQNIKLAANAMRKKEKSSNLNQTFDGIADLSTQNGHMTNGDVSKEKDSEHALYLEELTGRYTPAESRQRQLNELVDRNETPSSVTSSQRVTNTSSTVERRRTSGPLTPVGMLREKASSGITSGWRAEAILDDPKLFSLLRRL